MPDILYEKKDHIAVVTMNRPEKLNAYDIPMLRELEQTWYKFRDDDDAWVAIFTGAGRAFCAGHGLDSLEELGTLVEPPSIHYGTLDIFKPIIAAVNGHALGGGCSMVMGSDLAVAAENATFGYPQPAYGLTSLGGHQWLPRMVSAKVAAEIMLTGERYSAEQFYKMGLINKVVPLDQLMPEAFKMAERLTKNGPIALYATKENLIRGMRTIYLPDGVRFSQLNYIRVWNTEDRAEGLKAFQEKRPPQWKAK